MPYASIEQLPKRLKRYTAIVQRQWKAVFNSTFDKVFKETKSKKEADGRAFRAANSVLKKRLKGKESLSRSEHHDIILMKVDEYLGNLYG